MLCRLEPLRMPAGPQKGRARCAPHGAMTARACAPHADLSPSGAYLHPAVRCGVEAGSGRETGRESYQLNLVHSLKARTLHVSFFFTNR